MWQHFCQHEKQWMHVEAFEPCNWCGREDVATAPDRQARDAYAELIERLQSTAKGDRQ